MKKSAQTAIIATVIAILFPAIIFAGGGPFEVVISYKISYTDSKFTESQLAMLPKLMTITIKETKSKTEMATGMGNQTEIADFTEKTKVALLDLMGQKYAIKKTKEELQEEINKEPKPTVEITSETKNIAGYNCKKAIVTVEKDGEKTANEVWFTNELGIKNMNFDNPSYKNIDGVLMEFSTKTSQMTMKFTVSSIEKKNISAKEFEIPAEYKPTTNEELKSKFGGTE
jgi:GLPGLI family protein